MSDRAMATAEWARDQRELPGLTTAGKFMVQDEDDSGTYAYCLAVKAHLDTGKLMEM